MPIYQVQAPNGKVYNVEGPANADDNTLFAAANQLYQQDVNKQLRKEYGPGLLGTFAEGVGRGVEQLKTTFGDVIPAMAGQALGFEDYAKAQMQEAAEAQQRIQAERPPIFESYKEIESPYQFAQFGAEVFGEQFPNLLTALIPGVGGGAVAGRAALATVSKALTEQAVKRGLVGEAAELFVAEGVKRAAPSIAAKSAMGANVGAFLGSYTQTAPEVFQNIFEKTGQMELGTSMLFGAGSAALDSILPATLSKQLSGPLKAGIVEKVLEKSGMDRGLLRSTTAGLFTGVAGEGLTEGAQEAINIAAERFVEDNPEVFGSKEWDRIMEASVRGAIAGGGFGVAGGTVQRLREKHKEQIDAAAQEAAQTGEPVLLQLGYDPQVETPTAYGGQPIYVYPDGSTSFVSELSPDGFAEKYKEQINVAAQEAAQTGEPVPLKLGYDPQVETPTAYGGQPIYVYPDGSTSFVSELSPEGFAEKYPAPEAPTPPKQRAKEEKAEAIRARQAEQRQAAQVKEDAAALKKALAELTNVPTDLVSLAKGPTPLEQTVRQARGELDVLSAKRAPKTTAPPAEPAGVAEPTKRAPLSGLEGTIITPDKESLAAFGKQLGIGRTAKILREDGPLAGKDLSDPAQATEVKNILEAYASSKPAEGAAAKIEKFLQRPEFQITEPEVPSGRVDREPVAGAVEPSVPSVRGREVQSGVDTEGTPVAIPRGLDETRLPAGRSDEGEGAVERALTAQPTAAQPTAAQPTAAQPTAAQPTAAQPTAAQPTTKSPKKRTKKLSLPVHRGPELDTTGRAFAEAKNLRGLVTHLQNTTSSKPLKAILAKVKGLNLNTKLVIGPVGEGQSGSFDPRTNTITLDPQNGLNEHTVLHEVMHAAISHVLRNPNLPVTKQLTSLFNQLQNQLGAAYGAQDIQEFASELVSNPEFQALLKTLKAPKSESMFTRFMQTLAEFFGFAKNTSAYDKGLKLINDALDISGDVEPSVSDLLFLGTPNGEKAGFNAIDRAEQSKPSFTGKAVEATRNRLSNLPDDVRSVALGLVSLDHINAMYKEALPSLQKVIDYTELRAGMQEKRIKEVNEKYTRFQKVQKKHPQDMERMNDMAYDARLEQVDVIDPKFKPQPAQRAAYQRLKNIYSKLHPDVQRVYQDIRADYDGAINEYEDILLNSVEDPSVRRKLKAEYEARKRQIAFIPFLRRGDFWVEYDDNGERAVQAFESQRERQNFINTQLEGKKFTTYQNLNDATYSQGSLPPTSFIVGVMSQLEKQGASQELKNNIYQSYLALFPAESLAKNFMKSDNVRGMERDIVRGYGETMIKWARMLAATKYNPEIDKAFKEVAVQGQQASKTPEGASAFSAAEHVLQQAEFIRNPTYNKFVNAATTFNYFTYIAGSVASALVNLSTIPMFSWSILGARYGFDKAASALFDSSKVTINYIFSGKVPPKYAKLMQALDDHAQLQHTTARELLEGQRQKTSEFIGLGAKVMDLVSIPFAKSELLNRGATAIAAYDLARASGKSEADAIRYALDTNKELNTSGLGATAPRYLKHPAGRIFFAFKTFAFNSAFVVARAFHQAVKGQSPEVKREARRQLLGVYGTAIAFAGVQGLPFMGAVSTLANMIGALFGDEDEPFDFKLEMRQFLGDLFTNGGLNYATNLGIASRISIANDLIFRDDPKSVAEHGYVLTALAQAFGPLGSYALSVERGAELLAQGQLYRGVEAMMPTVIKNAMKGGRYMQEGVLNTKGEPIIEDISAYNTLMQVVGFSPANLTNVYEEISVKKGFERDVLRRRTQLLDKYDMARRTGDYELMQEAREEITEFNSRRIDAKAKITPDTLRRSEQAREAAERDSVHGVRFNKALMPEIDKLMEEE